MIKKLLFLVFCCCSILYGEIEYDSSSFLFNGVIEYNESVISQRDGDSVVHYSIVGSNSRILGRFLKWAMNNGFGVSIFFEKDIVGLSLNFEL